MPHHHKRAFRSFITCWVIGLTSLHTIPAAKAQSPSIALVVPEHEQVENFDFIGEFKVVKMVKVLQGSVIDSTPAEVKLRVFSNNQEIKIYHSLVDDSYQLFSIYRDDGITAIDTDGNLSLQPGFQARMNSIKTSKHLSLTGSTLVITEFPPITNAVFITTATLIQ